MIYEEINDEAESDLHKYLEESRGEYPNATTTKERGEYSEGIHRPVADAARKLLLGDMKVGDVKENVIGQCLEQISARVQFKQFSLDDEVTQKYLNDVFAAKNQLGKQVVSVVKRAQTDGSAAMSVSWKGGVDGRPVIHHEAWWDGDKGMYVHVEDSGDVEWALSEWYNRDNVKHRTLYVDDAILKYRQNSDGWRLIKRIEWLKPTKRPIGVPVAHFPNGASSRGPYPSSTVSKVMDAQDALNASLFNRMSVSALTGAQIYYGVGVGNPDAIMVGAGKFWSSANENAKFGAIPPGSLKELLEDTNDLRGVIAGEFPVPSYRLDNGDWPSGLALQRSDSPMIARASLLEKVTAPGLVMLAHRATELFNTFGELREGELNEDSMITAEWNPSDEVDPGTQVEIYQATVDLYAALADLPEPLLRKTGILTEKEIQQILDLRKEEEERMLAEAPPAAGARGVQW